jgi:hypothetical protein
MNSVARSTLLSIFCFFLIVTPLIEGLGEKDGFADVFVGHLAQTAIDCGVILK